MLVNLACLRLVFLFRSGQALSGRGRVSGID